MQGTYPSEQMTMFCGECDGLNFYNNNGEFIFEKFRSDCIKTCDLLFKKDKPHPNTGIKYELSDFMSAVQTIVGIRNITEFMQYQD